MTPREKLSILKKMRKELNRKHEIGHHLFLCLVYDEVTNSHRGYDHTLAELGLRKPIEPYTRISWYHDDDYTSRLRCIDSAIKRLTKTKSKKK